MASYLEKIVFGIGGASLAVFLGTMSVREETYQYKFRNSDTIKEPVRVLKEYPHSKDLLGENIKQLRIDILHKFNKKNAEFAQMVIPVHGSKGGGMIFSWSTNTAENKQTNEKWRVDRVDLVLKGKDPFTFFKHPDAQYVDDIKLEKEDLT